MRKIGLAVLFIAIGIGLNPIVVALAAEADLYWLRGTSSRGSPIFIPVTSANPLPTACM